MEGHSSSALRDRLLVWDTGWPRKAFGAGGLYYFPVRPCSTAGPRTLNPLFPCQKLVVTYGQPPRKAPVAQLDRATVYGTVGYTFEPCRVHGWARTTYDALGKGTENILYQCGRLRLVTECSSSIRSEGIKQVA
jgi:hypothetical protein